MLASFETGPNKLLEYEHFLIRNIPHHVSNASLAVVDKSEASTRVLVALALVDEIDVARALLPVCQLEQEAHIGAARRGIEVGPVRRRVVVGWEVCARDLGQRAWRVVPAWGPPSKVFGSEDVGGVAALAHVEIGRPFHLQHTPRRARGDVLEEDGGFLGVGAGPTGAGKREGDTSAPCIGIGGVEDVDDGRVGGSAGSCSELGRRCRRGRTEQGSGKDESDGIGVHVEMVMPLRCDSKEQICGEIVLVQIRKWEVYDGPAEASSLRIYIPNKHALTSSACGGHSSTKNRQLSRKGWLRA